MAKNMLEIRKLNKWFGPIHALRNINFELKSGEVCALLGDNGAGKSTLIKLIAGVEDIEQGELIINGVSVDTDNYGVNRARSLGIETVYQSGSLGEQQPLWRNLFLGRHIKKTLGFIDSAAERIQAKALLEKLDFRGVGANIDACVSALSGGERQGLSIGRAMLFDAKVVILDEPTTALSLGEVEKVLNFIEKLKQEGRACLLVTHNMKDAYRVADRFVMMDRGQIISSYNKSELAEHELHETLLAAVGQGAA